MRRPTPTRPPPRRSLNSLTAPRIVVREVVVAAPDFDARFSACDPHLSVLRLEREVPDPFLGPTPGGWPTRSIGTRLRRGVPTAARDPRLHVLLPTARGVAEDASLVRRVLGADWTEEPGRPDLLRFEIRATAFCHQMVRSIVGLVVDVGRGRRTPADITAVLGAADRSTAGQLAPPHGLFLWEVDYD